MLPKPAPLPREISPQEALRAELADPTGALCLKQLAPRIGLSEWALYAWLKPRSSAFARSVEAIVELTSASRGAALLRYVARRCGYAIAPLRRGAGRPADMLRAAAETARHAGALSESSLRAAADGLLSHDELKHLLGIVEDLHVATDEAAAEYRAAIGRCEVEGAPAVAIAHPEAA